MTAISKPAPQRQCLDVRKGILDAFLDAIDRSLILETVRTGVCGIGRGDSAVRVTNGKPTTLATMAEATHVIRELANGRSVDYKGSTITLPWATKSRLEVWGAGYGPRALKSIGETCDGFILQLADLSIAEWTIGAVRSAASAAGRSIDLTKDARPHA